MTNLCYNRLNSLRRQLLDTDVDDVDTLALSSDKDPATAVEAAERRAFLHRQIAALPAARMEPAYAVWGLSSLCVAAAAAASASVLVRHA